MSSIDAPLAGPGPVILHLVAEFSTREAIGRTITETATRVSGRHHLVAARIHDGEDRFASTHELGGSLSWFTFARSTALAAVLDEVRPDLVHIHGGPLAAVAALASPLRGRPQVHTIYAWPRVPRRVDVRRNGTTFRQLRSSNVLRPRVLVTTVAGPRVLGPVLRSAGASAVLTPDPSVVERLGDALSGADPVPVGFLPSGGPTDDRRASFDAEAPTVVFAGRAEHVRGITTLVDAFAEVRDRVPGARLRLLLLPTPELPDLLAAVEGSGVDGITVETGPIDDLLGELAAAQVGVWPFHYDSTTSPPAMALAEAMSVGLPVVSTPVACVRAVARPGSGVALVPTADPHALAAAITARLRSPKLWARASDAGLRSVLSNNSWDAAARSTAVVYDEVVSRVAGVTGGAVTAGSAARSLRSAA